MANSLQDELQNSAEAFSAALRELAIAIDGDISQVITKSILDVERNIIKRSPVDTGVYRGSHGIANTNEPSDTEGIVQGKKGSTLPPPSLKGWSWKVGDGDIFLFNNVPYAEKIENGSSNPENKSRIVNGVDRQSVVKAPQGVYRLAIPEFTAFFAQNTAKAKSLEPGGESI